MRINYPRVTNYNDNIREMIIDGKKEEVHVRYAACKGVLKYSTTDCNFIGSKSAKKCPTHPTSALVPTGSCPVFIQLIIKKMVDNWSY